MSTETVLSPTRTSIINSHIELDEFGRPWIVGANTKVIQVVMDKVAWGWTAEEMHRQHPHLSMAQLYAALAYYHDRQDEMDAEIARITRETDELAAAANDSPGKLKLRRMGLVP